MIETVTMLNINKAIANTTEKQRKWAKIFVAALAVILAATDAFLAIKESKGFPTFSLLFKCHENHMLWFTFLFGCLTGKIFYNRFTNHKKKEQDGIKLIGIVVAILIIIGLLLKQVHVEPVIKLLLFVTGILCASRYWPQYRSPTCRNREYSNFENAD